MQTLNERILEELKKNDYNTENVYTLFNELSVLYGYTGAKASFNDRIRRIKREHLQFIGEDNFEEPVEGSEVVRGTTTNGDYSFSTTDNSGVFEHKSKRITSLKDLIEAAQIDLNIWNIDRHVINKWEVGMRAEGVLLTEPLVQIKAWLSKKVPDIQQIPVVHPVQINYSGDLYRTVSPSVSSIKKTLVIADAQIGYEKHVDTGKLKPFHDRKSLDVILQILSETYFDEIVINGDMIDLPSASSFPQKPEFAGTFQPALNELGWFLSEIRRLSPKTEIAYLNGNHECFDEETEILTSEGFKKYYEVDKNTLIGTVNKDTKEIEYQKYIECQEYNYDGEMYKIEESDVNLLVTPKHRLYYKGNKPNYELQSIENILDDKIDILVITSDKEESSFRLSESTIDTTSWKKVNYSGKVWDFTVPNDTLIVKRKGKISVTGNCRLQKRLIENLSFAYNLKVVGEDIPIYSFRNLLNLDKLDIKLIEEYPSGQYWITDDLVVKHGEFTNLAKELSITTVNVIMGHLHRPETISKTIHSRKGSKTITVSCSPALCLNTGEVPGSTRPVWSTGFSYVETNRDTLQSNIHHVITQNGECIFNGKVYKGKEYKFN